MTMKLVLKKLKKFLLIESSVIVLLAASSDTALALNPGDVILYGSQWLGGNGVNIYYNGANGGSVWGNDYVNGIYVGLEWQCVDLAGRLYNVRGWQNGAFYDNACDIYPHAS